MSKNENQLNKAIAIFQLLLSQTDYEHVLKVLEIPDLLYDAFGIQVQERSVLREVNQLRDLLDTPVEDMLHSERILL